MSGHPPLEGASEEVSVRETTWETLVRPNTCEVVGLDIFDIRPDREL